MDAVALIEHLERLRAKATPGEWRAYRANCCREMGGVSADGVVACRAHVGTGHPMCIEDAEFVAALVNAFPALCQAVRDGNGW